MKSVLMRMSICVLFTTALTFSCSDEQVDQRIDEQKEIENEGNADQINVGVAEFYGNQPDASSRTAATNAQVKVKTIAVYMCRGKNAKGSIFFRLFKGGAGDVEQIAKSNNVNIEDFPVYEMGEWQQIKINFNLNKYLDSGEKYTISIDCPDDTKPIDNDLNNGILFWYTESNVYPDGSMLRDVETNPTAYPNYDYKFKVTCQSTNDSYTDISQGERTVIAPINGYRLTTNPPTWSNDRFGHIAQEFIPTYRNNCSDFNDLKITNISTETTATEYKFRFKVRNDSDEVLNLDYAEFTVAINNTGGAHPAEFPFKKKLGFLDPGASSGTITITQPKLNGLTSIARYIIVRDNKGIDDNKCPFTINF